MNHGHHQHSVDTTASLFALWNPWQLLLTLAIAGLYFYFIGKGRQRFDRVTPVKTHHVFLFSLGLFTYYMAAGSPLNHYGHHYLFSAHMLQQSLLYFVVPPLLIVGMPKYMLEALFNVKIIKKMLETNMLISIFAFNLMFSMYHLPIVFNTVMQSELLMSLSHLILFLAAFQMWWPIISPLPEVQHLTELRRMAYIICGAVLLTPACALIIFADSIVYETYVGVPEVFWWLPSMDDQQLGGVLMKLVQELAFGSSLAFIFFRWFRKDNPKDAVDLYQPAMDAQQAVEK